jgi:hypothetical protein
VAATPLTLEFAAQASIAQDKKSAGILRAARLAHRRRFSGIYSFDMTITASHPLRTLGNSDLQLTPIGFGAWAIGGGNWEFAWGPQDDNESIAAIHRALDLGVNWIDTAAIYGLGHSEEVVAHALIQKGDPPALPGWQSNFENSGSMFSLELPVLRQ